MNINSMTRKQFEELPKAELPVECTSLVILPGRAKDIHDSGYRLMDFVAVRDGKPIGRLSGVSDVLCMDIIGGSGGCGPLSGGHPTSIPPKGWSIDCLPKSGLLHLFSSYTLRTDSMAVSSFSVYGIERRR